MARLQTTAFFAAFLFVSVVSADWGHWDDDDDDNDGHWGPPSWWSGNNNDNNNNNGGSNTGNASDNFDFGTAVGFNRVNRILVAHAVMASLVWIVLIPTGGILLRLGIKNPIVLKIHIFLQIFSYVIFVTAAALGIYLANGFARYGVWEHAHPKLGVAILALASLQPILGYVHHKIFKKRTEDLKAGRPTKMPGRTVPGYAHLWLGRALLLLAAINGGLGIELAGRSPFQTDATTRRAKIIYGVVAGFFLLTYAILVVRFEIRRARARKEVTTTPQPNVMLKDRLPTYDESEESLEHRAPRYQ